MSERVKIFDVFGLSVPENLVPLSHINTRFPEYYPSVSRTLSRHYRVGVIALCSPRETYYPFQQET